MCKIPHQQRKYMYMYARELTNDDTRLSYRYIFLSHNQTLGQKKTYAFLILFIYLFFLCVSMCIFFLFSFILHVYRHAAMCTYIQKTNGCFSLRPGFDYGASHVFNLSSGTRTAWFKTVDLIGSIWSHVVTFGI